MDGSPSEARRTSSRVRTKPCEYWRNETKKLQCVEDELPPPLAAAARSKGALPGESHARPTSARRCLGDTLASAAVNRSSQRKESGLKGKVPATKGDGSTKQNATAVPPSSRRAEKKERTAPARPAQAFKVAADRSPSNSPLPPKAVGKTAAAQQDQTSPTRKRATAKKVAKAVNPAVLMPPLASDYRAAVRPGPAPPGPGESLAPQLGPQDGGKAPGAESMQLALPVKPPSAPAQKAPGNAVSTGGTPPAARAAGRKLDPVLVELLLGSPVLRGSTDRQQALAPQAEPEPELDERPPKRARKAKAPGPSNAAAATTSAEPGGGSGLAQAPSRQDHGGDDVKAKKAAAAAPAAAGTAGVNETSSDRLRRKDRPILTSAAAGGVVAALGAPVGGTQAAGANKRSDRLCEADNQLPRAFEQGPSQLPAQAPLSQTALVDAGRGGVAAVATAARDTATDAGVPSAGHSPLTPTRDRSPDASTQPARTVSIAAAAAMAGLTAAKRRLEGMPSGLQRGQQEHSSPSAEQQQPPPQQRQVGPAEGPHLVAEEQQQCQQGEGAEELRVRRRKTGKKRKRAAFATAAAAVPAGNEGTTMDAPAPAGRAPEDIPRESPPPQQQAGPDAAMARVVSRSLRKGQADGIYRDGPLDSARRGELQQPATVATAPATGSKGRTTSKARSASVARTRADEVGEQAPVAVTQQQAGGRPDAVGGEAQVLPPAAVTARGRTESVGRGGTPSKRQQQSGAAQVRHQRHEAADEEAYCDGVRFAAPDGDVGADHDDPGATTREVAWQCDAGGEAHEAAGDGSFPRRHGMAPQFPTASVTESVAQSNAYDPRRAARAAGACFPQLRPSDCGPFWLSQGSGRATGHPGAPAGAAQRPEAGPAASIAGPPARQGGWLEAGQQVPRRPVPPPPLFNAPSTADINVNGGRRKGADAIGSGGDGDMGRAGFQVPAAFDSRGDGGGSMGRTRAGGFVEGLRGSHSGAGVADAKKGGLCPELEVPAAHGSTHGFWNAQTATAPAQAAARQAPPQGGVDEQLYGTANAGRMGSGSVGIRPRVTLASRLRAWQDPYEMEVNMDEEEGAGDAFGHSGNPNALASRPGPSWESLQQQQQQQQQGDAGGRPDLRGDAAGAWRIEPQTWQPGRSAFPRGSQWAREEGPGTMAHAAEPQMSAAAAAGRAVPVGLQPAAAPASQPAELPAYERNGPTRMYDMRSSYSGGGGDGGIHDMNPNQESPDASYNCGRRHAPLAPAQDERSPRSPRDPRVWPRRAPSGAAAAPSNPEELPLPRDGEAPLRFPPHGGILEQQDIGPAGTHGMYDSSYGAMHTDDEGVDAGGGRVHVQVNMDAFGAGMRPEFQHPAARYHSPRQIPPYAEEDFGGHPYEEHVGRQEPQELHGQPPPPHPGQRPSGFSAALFGRVAAGCARVQSVPSHRDTAPHLAGSVQHVAAASVGPQAPARVDVDAGPGPGWGFLRGQPSQGPLSPNARDVAKHPMPPPPPPLSAQLHQQHEEVQRSGQHLRGRFVAPMHAPPLQPQQQQSAASGQPPRQQPEVFRVPSLRTGALGLRAQAPRSRANDEREGSQAQQQPQLSRQSAQAYGGGAGLLRPAVNPLGQPQPPGAVAGQAAASMSVSAASQKIFRALHRSEQTAQRLKARMQGVAETEEEGWTLEQVQALQTAYFRVEPTHPQFWREVARHVPGRTAGECFTRVFCSGKDAEERALLRKVMPRMRRLQPAGAPTSGRPVTLAAARKYSQKMHERDQLERLAHLGLGTSVADGSSDSAEEGDEGEGPAGAGNGQRRRLRQRRPQPKLPGDPTELHRILDDLQKKQQADRFVTSFLHRQGGWVKWHKAARAAQERMHSGQVPAATQAPAMGLRRGAEAAAAAGPAVPASGAGSGAASSQAHNDRGDDDALTRYIRRILAQDEVRKVRQAWREDDEAEGLEYDGYGSEDENDVDEEVDEEEEARLQRFLMAEGLVGLDGMPVLS